MPVKSQCIDNPTQMHDLLMQLKYCDAVKRLTRGVTHEYNNVFMGLSGQLTMAMHEEGATKTSTKRKELIEDLLLRGTEQTNILFDFSRESVESKSPQSPQRIARKAIDLLNAISRLHYFELEVENNLPKILSNQRDILLMLFYLGENGIEAMADGGCIELEVSHGPAHDGIEYVTFSMIDSGTGFSEKMQETACNPFTTTKENCTTDGLGLYAVQSIINDHGGQLEFIQRSEGGTIVKVDLPAPVVSKPQKENVTTSQEHTDVQHPPQKLVFFVIDDELSMRDLLYSRLQRHGHIVFCAESCAEAVDGFSNLSDTISVVLLDVWLRDDTGYDCALKLRKIDQNVPIIFMSGQEYDEHKTLDSKTSFLKKPFSIKQLEQMVYNVTT